MGIVIGGFCNFRHKYRDHSVAIEYFNQILYDVTVCDSAYSGLAYISYLEGRYADSIDYFHKILQSSREWKVCEPMLTRVLEDLSLSPQLELVGVPISVWREELIDAELNKILSYSSDEDMGNVDVENQVLDTSDDDLTQSEPIEHIMQPNLAKRALRSRISHVVDSPIAVESPAMKRGLLNFNGSSAVRNSREITPPAHSNTIMRHSLSSSSSEDGPF